MYDKIVIYMYFDLWWQRPYNFMYKQAIIIIIIMYVEKVI